MKKILKMFGKGRKPLRPEPKMGTVQKNLKDFNIENLNNTNSNVMGYLDVDHVSLERGGIYDEEE